MTPAGYKRSIYLPRELWARLGQAAKAEERTVSQWISIQLRNLLDNRDEAPEKRAHATRPDNVGRNWSGDRNDKDPS